MSDRAIIRLYQHCGRFELGEGERNDISAQGNCLGHRGLIDRLNYRTTVWHVEHVKLSGRDAGIAEGEPVLKFVRET
jgi:hypothetical protein